MGQCQPNPPTLMEFQQFHIFNEIRYKIKKNMIMETFLCVCMSVCVLQDFKITQYLGHFKSEFDAGKSKVGLLLEKIKTSISQSVYAPLLVSVPPFWYLRFRCFNSGFAIMIFDIAKVSLHTSKPKYL